MDTATARRTRSGQNCAYVRELLRQRHPALTAALDTAAWIAAGYQYELCPSCGGWRTRAVAVTSASPRGCGSYHAGECTSEFPRSQEP